MVHVPDEVIHVFGVSRVSVDIIGGRFHPTDISNCMHEANRLFVFAYQPSNSGAVVIIYIVLCLGGVDAGPSGQRRPRHPDGLMFSSKQTWESARPPSHGLFSTRILTTFH